MGKTCGVESYRLLQYFGVVRLQSSCNREKNERTDKNVEKRLMFSGLLGVHLKSQPIWFG